MWEPERLWVPEVTSDIRNQIQALVKETGSYRDGMRRGRISRTSTSLYLRRFYIDSAITRPASRRPSTARQPIESRPPASPPSVRAQLLATEHWSLLATRSMTQSEILTRISMFLTLVSASIVSLALIGQVTQFDQPFLTFALVLIGAVFVVGVLTQMRVDNASMEDLAHVIGMNRLRAAYVNLGPAIEHYLVTSAHDDDAGWWQTYNHLVRPNTRVQLLASSGAFIKVLNAGLAAIFGALVASSRDGAIPVVTATAVVGAAVFLGASVLLGMRQFGRMRERYGPQFASVQQ